jgi:hypothetical protein
VQGYQAIVELIDLRSFSNLWFWIALAVVWSTASHWVMGVPWDMVQRARRRGGPVLADVETLARINARRVLHIVEVGGVWASALLGFVLSMLAVLGFGFGIEFCNRCARRSASPPTRPRATRFCAGCGRIAAWCR